MFVWPDAFFQETNSAVLSILLILLLNDASTAKTLEVLRFRDSQLHDFTTGTD